MATYVKDGSGWQELASLDRPYANVGGTWQPVKNVYANVSGTWQETFAYFETSGGTSYDAGSGYAGVYFDSSGTFSILNGTRALEFAVVGGKGGNGGNAQVTGVYNNAGISGGGSGGGGGGGNINQSSVTAGPQSCSITIGATGATGTDNLYTWNGSAWVATGTKTNGSAGGTSSIIVNGTTYSATGGDGGGAGDVFLYVPPSSTFGAVQGFFYGGSGGSNSTYTYSIPTGGVSSNFNNINARQYIPHVIAPGGVGTGGVNPTTSLGNPTGRDYFSRGSDGPNATLLNASIPSSRVYIRWLI
jgi:hypothetical protein